MLEFEFIRKNAGYIFFVAHSHFKCNALIKLGINKPPKSVYDTDIGGLIFYDVI